MKCVPQFLRDWWVQWRTIAGMKSDRTKYEKEIKLDQEGIAQLMALRVKANLEVGNLKTEKDSILQQFTQAKIDRELAHSRLHQVMTQKTNLDFEISRYSAGILKRQNNIKMLQNYAINCTDSIDTLGRNKRLGK